MFVFLAALWLPSLVCTEFLFRNESKLFQEGDPCGDKNMQGTCSRFQNCSWALTRLRKKESVDICGFIGKEPIVCCLTTEKSTDDPSLSTNSTLSKSCNSTIQNDTSSAIAWSEEKCIQYNNPLVPQSQIVGVGGQRSLAEEFAHMAILGFGNESDKIWKCGGSLISLQHVLTAAHCLYASNLGKVKFVRLGDSDILDDKDYAEPQDFNVKLHIQHPEFDPSTLKHDIAILVLDRPAKLTDYVNPACLFTESVVKKNDYVTAAGWGIMEFTGQPSSHLMKFRLKIVENADCREQYKKIGTPGLIDASSQVCAGSADPAKIIDTCEGDSGGPLQLSEFYPIRRHFIIGVTSFGKACGLTKSAGVYTNVTSHIPWIKMAVTNNS